ncbi:MAG: zinc-ribbon domain [Chthonomonadaceae bacterium]|nr:zinc-ribbon domain [Chthonomonadaceae bacterium]
MNSTDTKPRSKAEREAEEKAKRRAEAATIVAGLKQAIDADEQLLGFARGRLAGGIRGKLSLGPEAFFAPFVNIGLTERRLVIQHINAETGRPGEILPHFYALGDIASLAFSDIETFGGESAARLTMRLRNDQHTRLRLRGQSNLESAQAIVEVFRSLTSAQRPTTTPTQRVCATCQHILDQPFKFCPYCGQLQDLTASAPVTTPAAAEEPERTYPPTPPGPTEPEFLDAVPYQDAAAFRGPTLEDGLDLLSSDPLPQPTIDVPQSEPVVTPAPEAAPESQPAPEVEPEAIAAAEPEASATAIPAEDAAFETPSAFEGWSVDPGASSAVVEPTELEEPAPPQGFTSEVSVAAGYLVDTEVSVAEAMPGEASQSAEPGYSAESQTDVDSHAEHTPPAVHPEAEFAPIPEPIAFTPEEAHAPVTVDDLPREAEPAPHPYPIPEPHPHPIPEPEPQPERTPDFSEHSSGRGAPPEVEPVPETETSVAAPVEFHAPPVSESFAETAPAAVAPTEFPTPESIPGAPTHAGAGFVTEPVAVETPTPVGQNFEPFVPVMPAPISSEFAAPPVVPEIAEPTVAPVSSPEHTPVASAEAAPSVAETPSASSGVSTSEDRFAALLREVRGGDAPVETAPPPAVERRDGPMTVHVHINRAPIVVNENFTGRNADEVVGKLKQRVLPELNFALRLMVNSFSNLRFAQEIVRRYNEREKTNYPVPNSCFEFLVSAEQIQYVTIHLNS